MAEFMADDVDWLRSIARTYPAGSSRARLAGIAQGIEDALAETAAGLGGNQIGRILIVKAFDDDADGGEAVTTSYSAGLSLVDALGMLAFATWSTPDTYMKDGADADDR
jgi:hypothetical protein